MSLASPLCLYESLVKQDNPLRWWGLDEASPTADDSGNGGTLTAVGAPANSAPLLTFDAGGTADGARDFNGTTQSYTAASLGGVSDDGCWTVEFWMQPDVVTGNATIFSSGAGALQIRRETTGLMTLTEGIGNFVGTTGLVLAAGSVYHVVITSSLDNFWYSIFSPSTSNSFFKIFVNGVEYQSTSNALFNTTTDWTGPRIGSKTGGTEWFDGKLDEFAVYDYALSTDQVLQHYNAGKNGTWGTQFLGATGTAKYPRFALEAAFGQTYHYQGLNQQMYDVSDLVRGISYSRGGDNAALNQPKAASMDFALKNTLGEFEDKTGARFYNTSFARSYAEPKKAVRLRLWWPDTATPVYSMFYGYVEAMAFQRRPGSSEPFVSFRATDVFTFLSQAEGDGASRLDELSNVRLAALLASTTNDLNLPQDFDTGNQTVDFKVSTGNLLSLIEQVTFTEGGGSVFFQAKDGRLKFFNSTKRSGASVTATYGSGLPYRGSDPVHDDHDVFTVANWENTNIPITTSQTDANYKLKHGDRIHTKETLHNSQALLDAAALAFVDRFKDSKKRIPVISPVPQASTDPATAWATWMKHEISDKITVVDTAEGGLGTTSLSMFVEGIGMAMGGGGVECRLNVSQFS